MESEHLNAPFQECLENETSLYGKFKLLRLNRVKEFNNFSHHAKCQTIFHAVQTPYYPLIKRQQIPTSTKVLSHVFLLPACPFAHVFGKLFNGPRAADRVKKNRMLQRPMTYLTFSHFVWRNHFSWVALILFYFLVGMTIILCQESLMTFVQFICHSLWLPQVSPCKRT